MVNGVCNYLADTAYEVSISDFIATLVFKRFAAAVRNNEKVIARGMIGE
jgi:hypothetical protein